MNSLISAIDEWISKGIPIALATVTKTWGSSPRGMGAMMAVNGYGDMVGSVSGGCVETAVIEIAVKVLESNKPQLVQFGVADETAWEVGLACGGEIEVLIRPLNLSNYKGIKQAWEDKMPVVNAQISKGPTDYIGREVIFRGDKLEEISGYAHSPKHHFVSNILTAFEEGRPTRALCSWSEVSRFFDLGGVEETNEFEVFFNVVMPPPTLVVVGGVHIAIPLIKFANILEFFTIIIDPRRKFANRVRFPHADQVIPAWPGIAFSEIELTPSTAVAILTHDPKIDDPALQIVLNKPVFYLGALGSKKTQQGRRKRLLEAGFSETQINRVKGPIGLDLGSRSPGEIALSIMAEIMIVKNNVVRDNLK